MFGATAARTVRNGETNGPFSFQMFLQGEEWPEGDGWRFLFQFSAATVGHDLADGAECYGYLREDGSAAFGWQCH